MRSYSYAREVSNLRGQSAFSLVREIREFWDGCLILGGGINDGHQIRAAEALGADLVYMGTRFIATQESNAQQEFKKMVIDTAGTRRRRFRWCRSTQAGGPATAARQDRTAHGWKTIF